MNIKFNLESMYFESSKRGGNFIDDYVFHSYSVFGTMDIDDQSFEIEWQNGQRFYNNNYNCPSTCFDLWHDSSHRIFIILEALSWEDIKEETENAKEALEEIQTYLSCVYSIHKLLELYNAFKKEKPIYIDILKDDERSSDLDDYTENDHTGLLELK